MPCQKLTAKLIFEHQEGVRITFLSFKGLGFSVYVLLFYIATVYTNFAIFKSISLHKN